MTKVVPSRIHAVSNSYWDSRLGSGESDRFLAQLAATIQRRHPAPQQLDMDPARWAQEGFALKEQVYSFTGGTDTNPARLSDAYSVQAKETAYARAALAGYRLAQFLKERF